MPDPILVQRDQFIATSETDCILKTQGGLAVVYEQARIFCFPVPGYFILEALQESQIAYTALKEMSVQEATESQHYDIEVLPREGAPTYRLFCTCFAQMVSSHDRVLVEEQLFTCLNYPHHLPLIITKVQFIEELSKLDDADLTLIAITTLQDVLQHQLKKTNHLLELQKNLKQALLSLMGKRSELLHSLNDTYQALQMAASVAGTPNPGTFRGNLTLMNEALTAQLSEAEREA